MIAKNTLLVDLTRLSEFKALCDKAYVKNVDGGEIIPPSSFSQTVTDDTYSDDEVLAIINATE